MKGFGDKFEDKKQKIKKNIKLSQEKIINQAFLLHSQGNIDESIKYYKYCIDQKFNNYLIYSNYGLILKKQGNLKEAETSLRKAVALSPNSAESFLNLGAILMDRGKLHEAEISLRKAISLSPNSTIAHSNLGNTLRKLKNFPEAEISLRKAIELDPNSILGYANLGNMLNGLGRLREAKKFLLKTIELDPSFVRPYYSLSRLEYDSADKTWHDYLFSEKFCYKKTEKEKIDIYFARSNLLHKAKKFQDSAKNLQKANELKLKLKPSDSNLIINKSNLLLKESNQEEGIEKEHKFYPLCIFIVGMPRSGSTLIESILSLNSKVKDLGEINILEKAFIKNKKLNQKISLIDLYMQEINQITKEISITSNKWLYNYQYAGIIAKKISNSKIIHCFRNPLDNILSITRANFDKGNYYSSSLRDCTEVYLDQEQIMSIYKDQFQSNIYSLNYDLLVKDPQKEIKSLIHWLGWDWKDDFLSPHLNERAVYTASDIQVRSPINSKSTGGWKNYKDLLKPAIEILKKHKKFKDIF